MKKLNFLISLYLIPLKTIISGLLYPNKENVLFEEDEEMEYLKENKDKNYQKSNKQMNKKAFQKPGFDIGDSLRILYKNYSSIELGLYDLLNINKKEIINQYQVITIWEYLLNVKTGRNIELFGNNKLNYEEKKESKENLKLFNLGNNSNNNHNISLLSFLKQIFKKIVNSLGIDLSNIFFFNGSMYKNNEAKEDLGYYNEENLNNELKKEKNGSNTRNFFMNVFEHLNIDNKHTFSVAILLIGGVFNKINKYFLAVPKLNMLILSLMIFFNLKAAFSFYAKALFFPSFLNFWLFINNLHDFYLSIVVLSGNKEKEFSIFFENNFKSEKIFYIKCFMASVIILINKYFSLCYFRKFYFYLLDIFYINILKAFITNFNKNSNLIHLQPLENFVAFVFGISNLFFANGFYLLNSAYGYEYNSYLFINNLYSLYLLTYLDDLIFSYKNNLGELYLENKHLEQERKNIVFFKSLKQEVLQNRQFNLKNLLKNKANISTDLDLIFILFVLFILLISFLFDSIFAVFLSLYAFYIYRNNFFPFYSIKEKRIIWSIFLGLFLFCNYNTKFYNLYHINHLVAVNDERFVLAMKLLIKLFLTFITLGCFFFSKDFFGLLNLYNYTSYKYVLEEGINEQKGHLSQESKFSISKKISNFSFTPVSENIIDSNNEKVRQKFFDNNSCNLNSINNINKINFINSCFFNSESFNNEYGLLNNPVFDYGINPIKNINLDKGINANKNVHQNNNSIIKNNQLNYNNINKNINNININNTINSNTTNPNNNQNNNYNKYLISKDEESTSQYACKIREIYNLNNSLDEIFCFSIEKSTSYINSILETINFNNNNSSKIDSVYIEFLITRSTKHVHLLGILLDYFLLYLNFWLANFTIKEENQNNYLFSGLLQAFKLGIFLQLFFIIFEYSKSRTQIITIIILNCIFLNRLITYNEAIIIDYYVLTLLINLNKVIYFYFLENSYLINLVIFIFSFIEFRRNKEILLLCFLICCLCLKTIFAYFKRVVAYKKLSFMVFAIVFIFLFMFIHEETLFNLYEFLQESLIWYTKIDLIGIFEYISFNSITIPSKYFTKDKSNFIYLQRSNFFEEHYTREFLKYFIRYKLIKL